jgi:23S rRNA (pseudouridine1915-N3)-methyltransferase
MTYRLIVVGKCKDKPIIELCHEYQKRITDKVIIDEIDGRKYKNKDEESAEVIKRIKANDFVVALDEKGLNYNSEQLAKQMAMWKNEHQVISFIIGGADGHADILKTRANQSLSFGQSTFPHMLVRVMLLEQIYRCQQINKGHPYHRA